MKINFPSAQVEAIVPEHFPQDFEQLLAAYTPFQDYLRRFSKAVEVSALEFQSVDLFGKRIGFLKFKLKASCAGKQLPGIVFMRGPSVAILVVVNRRYVLLTNQYRIPIGYYFAEIPAGMLDENEQFAGAAARELEEECGIRLSASQLKDLGEMVPSAGGCDERIHLYRADVELPQDKIEAIQSQVFGEGESESIRCTLITVEEAAKLTDAKLLCCLARTDL